MAVQNPETKIVFLKTNDILNPIGIDSDAPHFSWQMQSDAVGQKQTAYQIQLSESSDLSSPVWDSGKIADENSVAVAYKGDPLRSSTRYYWAVAVWDKDGVKTVSDTAMFETGLLEQGEWNDSQWIQVGSENLVQPGLDYTIETDITVSHTALGIYFEATDTNNTLMWQLNTKNGLSLKTHYRKSGSYKTIDEVTVLPQVVGTAADAQKLKIHVTSEYVETFINGVSVNKALKSQLGGIGLKDTIGNFGIRASRTDNERGSFENFKITNNINAAINLLDFSSNPFTIGATAGITAENGKLNIDALNSNIDAIYPNLAEGVHYTVETSFTSAAGGGIVFNYRDDGNFYMWQINVTAEPGKVFLRPHRCLNGKYANFDSTSHKKDITSLVGGVDGLASGEVIMTIEVTSTEIITSINGTQVDSFPFSETGGIPAYCGRFGARTDGNENIALSYIKSTDYSSNSSGDITADYNFKDGSNPLIKGQIEDGRLVVTGKTVAVRPLGISTFRKEFDISKEIVSAKLYSTALGIYDVYINGQPVGNTDKDGNTTYDVLRPGFSQMDERVFYQTYDVTDLIKSGENVISSYVSSGWWSGWIGSFGTGNAFRAQLLLTYDDGTEVVGTGTDWKTSYDSPILEASIFNGEVYDSNRDASWMDAGYNDSEWQDAAGYNYPGIITSGIGTTVRVRDDLTLETKKATVYNGANEAVDKVQHGVINIIGEYGDEAFTLKKGETAIFDLGQNFAGWAEIKAEGDKNTIITLRHSEMLNDNKGLISRGNDGPEGSIYIASLRTALATDRYIMNGNGTETYHPTHTFHGFRYVEVTASADIKIEKLTGIVVTSVEHDTGMINTSSKDINQLFSNIRWGQYSNYLSVPTDCPQRDERQGWGADTQVFSIAGMYNAESKAFLTMWLQAMRDAQLENGAYTDTAPYSGWAKEKLTRTGGKEDYGWTDAGVIVPYNIYKMSGDKSVIEENYTAMKAFMDEFLANTDKYGAKHGYGDWLGFEDYQSKDINNVYAISYYAWDALMMTEMAEALGYTDDAEKYRAVYETEKEFYIEYNVNSDGTLRRAEQTACLLALKFNLLPNAESAEKVKQQLLDNIAKNGDRLQTGFLGTAVIMQTLTDIGCADTAYKLLMQRDMPSWLYSVDQGATTIWERWNSYTKKNGFGPVDMNSFNHYSYGSVAEWMYGYMIGIMYDKENAGFKHFTLAPYPNQILSFANGSYESPYGTITSNWKYEGNRFIYNTVVPANSSATVKVPVEDGKQMTVNGKPAASVSKDADGIEYINTENGVAVFEALAGKFEFATDISKDCFISIDSDGVSATVRIDGGEPQKLPAVIKAKSDCSVTIEASPVNSVDYKFKSFSGDYTSDSNTITITPGGNMDITVNSEWCGLDNLAVGKTVTCDNSYIQAVWKPENLVDGILESVDGNLGFTTRGSSSAAMNNTVEIDLGENTEFNRIQLYPRTDKLTADGTVASFPKNFEIYIKSDEAAEYTLLDSQTNATAEVGNPLVLTYENQSARYIKITVTETSGKVGGENDYYLQLTEFGIYNTESILKGDLDADGSLTVSDVVALRQIIMNTNFTADNLKRGDLNSDNALTVSDVVALRQMIMQE